MCVVSHGETSKCQIAIELNDYLSRICDIVYNETPIFQNELINRRKISGTVTAARRELIQAMIENENKKDLAIDGFPPEMSIYRSLLRNTGIHRKRYKEYGFYRPRKDNSCKIVKTWEKIEEFFEDCEIERQPVEELYKRLMKQPFGIRRGPLPILLCAALLHYKTKIALYEDGSFVADLSMPVFERLLKAPKKFELKRFQMTNRRTDVLAKFLDALDHTSDTDAPNILSSRHATYAFYCPVT